MTHDLYHGLMRYFDIAEYDNLPEFIGKQRVADVIVFFDKKMLAFPDNLRALRVDVYNHSFPPFRGEVYSRDPAERIIRKTRHPDQPRQRCRAGRKEKAIFFYDIRLSMNDGFIPTF